jgi:uncharacterized protein (UPF0335 family)
MADVDLLRRVEMLEGAVESLRVLPGEMRQLSGRVERLESQFVQLRAEMRDGFSAIRGEMATKADLAGFASKADLADGLDSLRTELREDIAGAVLELTGVIVETRRELAAQTRTLMEDVISRLRVLGEGRN